MNSAENTIDPESEPAKIHADAVEDVKWFESKVTEAFGEQLENLTIFGPSVTSIYDPREHRIHPLIRVKRKSLDELLHLASFSKPAAKRRIAPPLVMTPQEMRSSRDVFPLEWLDVVCFHVVVHGQPILDDLVLAADLVRLQCERDLRSLDVHVTRGVLASGGRVDRIARVEDQAADSLVRVLRGMTWLSGNRQRLLPQQVCEHVEGLVQSGLPGCRDAIDVQGRHDVETVGQMLDEFRSLVQWVDQWQA